MQCEVCHPSEATVHLKQVSEEGVKNIHVCRDCAEKCGFDIHSPASMMDLLFGLDAQPEKTPKTAEEPVCPGCNMKLSDFRKRSRLGCAECYQAFAGELAPLLCTIHRGPFHRGKVPAGQRLSAEINSLDRALREAVSSQNFEEAARLRDLIRTMKSRSKAEALDKRLAAQECSPQPQDGG